jgi:uncharacterized protein YndB with AHSA1/START domain
MTLPPIIKTITVNCAPQQAFRYFTEDFGKWWPAHSHSVTAYSSKFTVSPASCELEPGNGGRIIERTPAGELCIWGTILQWEPPSHLAFTWHPGKSGEAAQRVDITFSPNAEGTRITLTHGGWEKTSPQVEEDWKSYNKGWESVFVECFSRYIAQNSQQSQS